MVAERFTINEGEKVLVTGCRKQDFEAWMRDRKVMFERVDFLSEDDLNRLRSVSSKYKGILMVSHISHSNSERLVSLAKKNGINFFRKFDKALELKLFLEMSVPISTLFSTTTANEKNNYSNAVSKDVTIEEGNLSLLKVGDKNGEVEIMELRKPKLGEVQSFVKENANFDAPHSKKEVQRLFDLSLHGKFKTTFMSMEVAYYRCRRLSKAINPASVEGASKVVTLKKTKIKKEDSVIQKYLDSIAEFSNNSIMAGVAIKELLEKVAALESQIQLKDSVNSSLVKENDGLKKEIQKLKNDFKKRISDFMKEF